MLNLMKNLRLWKSLSGERLVRAIIWDFNGKITDFIVFLIVSNHVLRCYTSRKFLLETVTFRLTCTQILESLSKTFKSMSASFQ